MTDPCAGTLLLVCKANLIRSPLAGALVERELRAIGRTDLVVVTAGLDVVADAHLSQVAVDVGRDFACDLSDRSPVPLTPDLVAAAALVVTMTEAQRAEVVRRSVAVVAKTFTFAELTRLLAHGSGTDSDWSALGLRAHRARPFAEPATAAEDVPDPVGRGPAEHRAVAVSLTELSARLVGQVTPAVRG